jgi:hypothetical protein
MSAKPRKMPTGIHSLLDPYLKANIAKKKQAEYRARKNKSCDAELEHVVKILELNIPNRHPQAAYLPAKQ